MLYSKVSFIFIKQAFPEIHKPRIPESYTFQLYTCGFEVKSTFPSLLSLFLSLSLFLWYICHGYIALTYIITILIRQGRDLICLLIHADDEFFCPVLSVFLFFSLSLCLLYLSISLSVCSISLVRACPFFLSSFHGFYMNIGVYFL